MSMISCMYKALCSNFAPGKKRIAGQRLWVDGVFHNPESWVSPRTDTQIHDMYVLCFSHGNPTVGVQVAFLDIHFKPWWVGLSRFFSP